MTNGVKIGLSPYPLPSWGGSRGRGRYLSKHGDYSTNANKKRDDGDSYAALVVTTAPRVEAGEEADDG